METQNKGFILLVEDEANLGLTLQECLILEGYSVIWVQNCKDAKLELSRVEFDLAVLDVGLPDGDGFSIAEYIRKVKPLTAILFLTAFSAPDDRVRGLELGAEDYVTKPFVLKELFLRIQNSLKRAGTFKHRTDEMIVIGDVKVSFSKFQVYREKDVVSLSHKECALLRLLFDKRGLVVSRDEILSEVWSEDEYPSTRTIDNFIVRLRKLLEKDPNNPVYIKSIRGVGYQLILE